MTAVFVLDCSVPAAWCFPDETDAYAAQVLDALNRATATVPSVWALEVANVLLVGERRGRIEPARCEQFVSLLSRLPIRTDHALDAGCMAETMSCGRRSGLSAYDAAYLALAIRREAPIATLGQRLIEATEAAGVGRFKP